MSKHTSGPWKVSGRDLDRIMNADGQPILYAHQNMGGEETTANLQVSAAAPDMYEALKALLRWANRLPDGDYKRAIEAARAAIAKAEGN